ncbi:MAG: metal-sensing transcriptional repressor [Fusobacterium gastrosuis]|uniref:metal-sensing transcriptional repressor n=1 Tax=Fusobacterium TaxID=848 RepID=UPI001F4FB477|nr:MULTISPECIES: metal-sensing transcriptional repressor [Fusobacterium]MDD7392351.1 metal-sensing transcriptional repressor [Fusobacteriaceae bacterium]MCI5724866.1 metal-sensing transcriptional repressor [Fusobacterium sp.]MCI7222910.1 metal-sensing transcriptional repressor [Fusobacterium sp.]MDD7409806.1 metal-sensing transcriptional repressor [Fusobacteriaceae bacterium]MDY4010219.1 metal-sensing transcriptional repressor [Fusobacterium gastrosuis]
MKQCIDQVKVNARLKKIEGQIKAISGMIDKDIPCEDILIQINAIKSAVHKVGQLILEGHLNHCVKEAIESGDADEAIKKFEKAVDYFAKMK